MKKISSIFIAVILALLIAAVMPAQVFADSVPEYISEVKIGMGKEAKDAEAALAGYTILTDENGNKVDLNDDAGGGLGSKGDKVVYLGYKTTTDRKDAITDLALMNMKGKYSVEEYEALMEKQMKSQIIPFVEDFQKAIDEYRVNYYSDNTANQARAQYIHDILDKFKDDDCGGKGLGELLLSDTKYEMGVKAYNKLSDSDKAKTDVLKESDKAYNALPEADRKNHADILTILAQSNGKATLMMENLITRAADTGEDTWLDRFTGISYEDLADSIEMLPTDAEAELAKMYQSDAKTILSMYADFRENLMKYDTYKETVDKYNEAEAEKALAATEALNEKSSGEEIIAAAEKYSDAQDNIGEVMLAVSYMYIHDSFDEIDYKDGTLLDFFTRDPDEMAGEIEDLYPLVASLSDGQRAGLKFVTLRELAMIALSDESGYSDEILDEIEDISIYEGVDRGIYQKGGVALTSDAIKSNAIEQDALEGTAFSWWTITSLAVTGAATIACIGSAIASVYYKSESTRLFKIIANADKTGANISRFRTNTTVLNQFGQKSNWLDDVYAVRSTMCKQLAIGLGIAAFVFAGVTTVLAYRDMVEYYKVEFTPIPHYMVDEKDITAFDENGNKIVLKNQAAYYKAVECNRTANDEFYNMLGTCADMNGDVGRQWLALYAQKSDTYAPILADSLIVKVNDGDIPAGYTTGIHMFGSASAFNLNSELYDWNKSAPSVFVYFKVSNTKKTGGAAGSNFSAGNLALACVAGFVAGALISAVAVTAATKKKKTAAA